MLAFPISAANYASTITFSCSAHPKPLFFAPYNFNISEPRRFSVFRKSEHKAQINDFHDVVENIRNDGDPSSFENSPPATGSDVTPSRWSNDSDPAVENKQIVSVGELLKFEGGIGLKVSVDLSHDEYNLKIKRNKFSSPSDLKEEMEIAEQTAYSAGLLFLQAEMLREMGDQLLAQYPALFRSTLTN